MYAACQRPRAYINSEVTQVKAADSGVCAAWPPIHHLAHKHWLGLDHRNVRGPSGGHAAGCHKRVAAACQRPIRCVAQEP